MSQQTHGLSGLLKELPELRCPTGIARLLAITLLPAALMVALQRRLDRLGMLGSIIGQILAFLLGMSIVAPAFRSRRQFLARYGDRAYRHAFWWHIAPGIPTVMTSAMHLFVVPGGRRPRWTLLPAVYLAATGIALLVGAFRSLGIDTIVLRYVYRPAQGPLVTTGTLGFLRHPTYSAGSRIALALGLLRGGRTALATAAIVPLAFAVWARKVEEAELLARFDQAYQEYRLQVSAFFVTRPSQWPPFWRQLVDNFR